MKNTIYQTIIIEGSNTDNLIKNIKELYYAGKLTRGFRGIISSVIIFSMNILNISAQYQVGLINGIVILKNPDFRGELENEIYSKTS